jgi:hypothetical protein
VRTSRSSEGVIEHRQAGDELIVDVDPPLSGARTLTFRIAGRPGARSASEIGARRVVLAPSPPWYPALPAVWATASITIRAPEGWGAIAPGTPSGGATWSTPAPVRSLAVGAAPGLRVDASPMIATTLHLATAGASRPSATATAARLAPSLAWLSGALAPYPFVSFNLALLPGYSGRVEASGLAILGADTPLAGDADGADVLSGQWLGQLVAGDGAWMRAFAAWEACVFARDRALPLPAAIAALRTDYFRLLSGDVPLATATGAAPQAVLRGKGSAVPDMIRLHAGDRATFGAIRELFAEAPRAPLALAELRARMEKHAGRSLARSFSDWFERTGAPEIAGTLRAFPAAGGGFRADLAVDQKRGLYELPVEVVIHGAGGERRETVEISGASTSVHYVVPFEPRRVEIDPLRRIFRWE